MMVIGLTGGIGMGKSTLAAQFARLGVRICNADAIVHRLLAEGGAGVEGVRALFPEAVRGGAVDRKALGAMVFQDRQKLKSLERLLHPLVVAEENHFIRRQRLHGVKTVLLDIPLLFETGAQKRCDLTVLASAPPFLQKQRVMRRPGMTLETFHRIVAAQMPEREKRVKADFVIPTGLGKGYSFRKIVRLIGNLHES